MPIQTNDRALDIRTLNNLKVIRYNFNDLKLSRNEVMKFERKVLSGLPDEKFYTIIEVNDYLKLSDEIKEYLISEERSWKLAGEAIVISSFAQKLILDFYFQFNLPLVPTKTFTQRSEALSWLERLA